MSGPFQRALGVQAGAEAVTVSAKLFLSRYSSVLPMHILYFLPVLCGDKFDNFEIRFLLES